MLQPKRSKYRKQFRGVLAGIATRGTSVSFGTYGLKAMTGGWVSSQEIEAARRAMTGYTKRGGRIYIRIFPAKPITKKPAETRMGGGKGDINKYVAVVEPGRILFEMSGISEDIAKEAMRLASHKLSVRTRFIIK